MTEGLCFIGFAVSAAKSRRICGRGRVTFGRDRFGFLPLHLAFEHLGRVERFNATLVFLMCHFFPLFVVG